MAATHPLIRTIYLYLFALLGLVLVIISGVRFLDMGLKAFVFKQAEQDERLNYERPQIPPVSLGKIAGQEGEDLTEKEEITLTAEEKERVDVWIAEYNAWLERRAQVDPITARRQREASGSLAMLLVGLPLYLYHWRIIRKEASV